MSTNRLQMEMNATQNWRGRILAHLADRPQLFIATMLVGNNLAIVFCGLESGAVISEWMFAVSDWTQATYPFVALGSQTLLTTIVILILAEFIPKALFHSESNHWLNWFALPLLIIHYVLIIPGVIVTALSQGMIWMLVKHPSNDGGNVEQLGATDLDHFIREMSGRMEPEQELEHELQIMQNALEFGNILARDCLVPRNEVVAVDWETPLEEVRDLFISSGLSKVVVFKGDIDQTIGYVHSKDLFRNPSSIKSIMHPTFVVPEPMPANDVLRRFIQRKRHLAIVVDEFGGTSGILTMEDIMEQLVGNIEDEHDVEDMVEEALGNHSFRFSAGWDVNEINEKHSLDLPLLDAYETLSGLILHHTETIPEPGFELRLEYYKVTVEEVSLSHIELIRIDVLPSENE